MRAIILAGGQDTHLVPLVRTVPKPLLPVANRPMVEYLLQLVRRHGIREVALALSGSPEIYQQTLGDGRKLGLRLTYSEEPNPRGTAGCLLSLADFIGNEPFLVIHGSLFLDADLKELGDFHVRKGAAATLAVRPYAEGSRDWHHLELQLDDDSQVRGIRIRNLSDSNQLARVPAGVYVFDPSVLSSIDPGVYFDIKEQLLPRLRDEGRVIQACELRGYARNILELEDYLRINRAVLRGDVNGFRFEGQIAEGIWVGRGTQVSQMATLLGPVMIGRDCVIGPQAQIIGPACIGDGCVVEEGSLMRESLMMPGARIERNSRVEGCVLAADTVISPGQALRGVVAIPEGLDVGDIDLADTDILIRGVAATAGHYAHSKVRYMLYRGLKRALDMVLSAAGLILLLPLILVTAVAIKLSSPGPVFFRQRRCGRSGGEFWMVKFRTMVKDAEKMQAQLRPLSEVDGPVFKIENDPRSTALGRLLRRYSIDEVPQLWNVLKGEMSLVGPRPLAAREMKFCNAWRDARLKVRPGVTGLWQVSGRSKTSFHDWIRLDIEYVRERSTLVDMKILGKTFVVVLRGLGSF
ncbi:MAG TPA: sugar transferase [Candidatus Polarisedimenticolia bacterium]|jgi:NDP-sugar pyrophosphorylase family protein|nr:sugar transferase [Candidatus Polarisedimenticolia bacterium]